MENVTLELTIPENSLPLLGPERRHLLSVSMVSCPLNYY